MMCWHKWGKWDAPFHFGGAALQNRTCEKCGKVEQREVGYSKGDSK